MDITVWLCIAVLLGVCGYSCQSTSVRDKTHGLHGEETITPEPTSISNPVSLAILSAAPEGMVLIPTTTFVPGCQPVPAQDCPSNLQNSDPVTVEAFYIDRYEVSVGKYAACVKDGTCNLPKLSYDMRTRPQLTYGSPQSDQNLMPINGVTWEQSQAYCMWIGKRLPTALEWELAARGQDAELYPWGDNQGNCKHAVIARGPDSLHSQSCSVDSPQPSGSRPSDTSSWGIADMAGNVSEWTQTSYPSSALRVYVVKGGSFVSSSRELALYQQTLVSGRSASSTTGFRCAKSLEGETL